MSKTPPFFRTPFNFDTDQASVETGLFCPPEEGVTQQHFAKECDINEIVRRFGLTGEMPAAFPFPMSAEFDQVVDFKTAMDAVLAAKEGFMSLPGEMRARFGNDPQQLLAFLEDPSNKDEAVKLGLVAKPPEKFRDVVQAVDELSAKIAPPAAPKAP